MDAKTPLTVASTIVLVAFSLYVFYVLLPIISIMSYVAAGTIGLCALAYTGRYLSIQIAGSVAPWQELNARSQAIRLDELSSQFISWPSNHVGALRKQHTLDIRYMPKMQIEEVREEVIQPLQIAAEPSFADGIRLSDSIVVDINEILSARKLICGVSGAGKSNSVAVLCEELGRYKVPLLLADTENEYESLVGFFPNPMRIGSSELNVEGSETLASHILEAGKQCILNLQSFEFEEAANILVAMINGFRLWQESRDNGIRIPCELILEEATTWLPQNVSESELYGSDVINQLQSAFFNDLVRKGRKRGLGLTTVCQKIGDIDKRALQSDVKIYHRQTELNDIERYRKSGISKEETLSLGKGECFFFSPSVSKKRVKIRVRNSPHGAHSPNLANLQAFQRENLSSGVPNLGFHRQKDDFGLGDLGTQIIELYSTGMGRKEIQKELNLNGHQYADIKRHCDKHDKEQESSSLE